ncbi:divalent metal cation transporter, partial [Bacillus sp. D-CC]
PADKRPIPNKAGLSSSSVGTMSGDIIMQGFIRMHIPLYLRRFITMIPPLVIIALGVNPTYALVMSQVGICIRMKPCIIISPDIVPTEELD